MTETAELIALPAKETALAVFSAPMGLDPYLAKIKEELDAFVPDVSTKKGRDAIASIAYKVAKGKTALDNIGKDLVADLKDVPKKIDAERKRMRDLLDLWKDDVRRPLTEWENTEAQRVAAHKADMEGMADQARQTTGVTAADLNQRLQLLEAQAIGDEWEEFEQEAHRVKALAIGQLKHVIAEREAFEAEQAELVRLRAEAAAREQQEREVRIAREAEDRTRREAEAQAQAERDAATRREAEASAAADRR